MGFHDGSQSDARGLAQSLIRGLEKDWVKMETAEGRWLGHPFYASGSSMASKSSKKKSSKDLQEKCPTLTATEVDKGAQPRADHDELLKGRIRQGKAGTRCMLGGEHRPWSPRTIETEVGRDNDAGHP